MKRLFIAATLLTLTLFSGRAQPVSTIDFVKIKNDRRNEAFYFYANNWKVYREIALSKGYITSYALMTVPADSAANFDILLITEYADSNQLKLSEERFQQIIKTMRPGGPQLLNDLKPNDFRQNMFSRQAQTVFSSGKTP